MPSCVPRRRDNLVADGRVEPCVVVFVDPRWAGQNRRQQQYVQNPGFAAFVAEELVPTIDAAYRTRPDRESRVILGTSLGGVFAYAKRALRSIQATSMPDCRPCLRKARRCRSGRPKRSAEQ